MKNFTHTSKIASYMLAGLLLAILSLSVCPSQAFAHGRFSFNTVQGCMPYVNSFQNYTRSPYYYQNQNYNYNTGYQPYQNTQMYTNPSTGYQTMDANSAAPGTYNFYNRNYNAPAQPAVYQQNPYLNGIPTTTYYVNTANPYGYGTPTYIYTTPYTNTTTTTYPADGSYTIQQQQYNGW